MRKITRIGMFVPLLAVSLSCWANGGPVDWTEGKPTGGIEPRQENDIELLREDLDISIVDLNTYRVDANYLLRNAKAVKRITYGVPLYWVMELKPKEAASGIEITVDKKSYSCRAVRPKERTDENSRVRGEALGTMGDAWCLAEIEIPKGDAVRLHLSYTADLEFEDWEFSKSAKTEFSNRTLIYPLAPAGYWKGSPDLNVALNLGPYKDSVAKVVPEGSKKKSGKLSWKISGADLKTLKELNVEFNAKPLLQHQQFVTWNATAHSVQKVEGALRASSTLEHADNRYAVKNMMDGDPSTAWCEGKKGDGVGESFTIQVEQKPDEHYCHPEGIVIVPGYAKSEKVYLENGRINKLRMEDCEDPSSYVELAVKPEDDYSQSAIFINTHFGTFIPAEHVEAKGGAWADEKGDNFKAPSSCLRFIINEALPGKRFNDTCISEVAFVRNCG